MFKDCQGSLRIVQGSLRIVPGSLRIVQESLRIVQESLRIVQGSLRIVQGSLRILGNCSTILKDPQGYSNNPEGNFKDPQGSSRIVPKILKDPGKDISLQGFSPGYSPMGKLRYIQKDGLKIQLLHVLSLSFRSYQNCACFYLVKRYSTQDK